MLRDAAPRRACLAGALATAGWLHARRLARHLLVLRRPRRVAETFLFLLGRHFQERVQRTGMSIDVGMTITVGLEPRRHGLQGEVGGIARVDLLPRQRR